MLSESSVLHSKLKALILDVIHNLSVVRELLEVQVRTTDDWTWTKRLRFYLDTDRQCCTVRMVDAVFDYTYEYQVSTHTHTLLNRIINRVIGHTEEEMNK